MTLYSVTKVGVLLPFQCRHDFKKSTCFGIRHLDLYIGCLLLCLVLWTYYLISFASGSSSIKWRFYRKIEMNIEHLAHDLAHSKHSVQVSLSFL